MFIYDLKVGYSCNNRCVHCIIETNKEDIKKRGESYDRTTEECKKEIDKGAEQLKLSGEKLSKIVVTGGEPTIRKDFVELCDYIVKKEFSSIDLQTNGRALSNYDLTQNLIANYSIRFVVALHGASAEIHDKVTTREGSYDETVQGIKNIVKCNGKIMGKIVISKSNYLYLTDIVKLYDSLGVKSMDIAFPHSSISDKRFFNYVPRYAQVKESINAALDFAKSNSIYAELECMPFCMVKGNEEYVSELELKKYNTMVSAVKSKIFDWQKVRREIKSKAKVCEKCFFNEICEGVWQEYIYHYGEDEFKEVTDLKQFITALSKIQKLEEFRNIN